MSEQTCYAHAFFGARLRGRDGDLGRVHDVYFDDRRWAIRYLVVDTGGWRSGRRVLVLPESVRGVATGTGQLEVDLTRAQLLEAPDFDTAKPVSRQHEAALHEYYGIPFSWRHDTLLDTDVDQDPHLRSVRGIHGYTVRVGDAPLGRVADFVVDVPSWALTDVVVAAHHWPRGGRLLMPMAAIERVSWLGKTVYVEHGVAAVPEPRSA